jgi:hypothetical protein
MNQGCRLLTDPDKWETCFIFHAEQHFYEEIRMPAPYRSRQGKKSRLNWRWTPFWEKIWTKDAGSLQIQTRGETCFIFYAEWNDNKDRCSSPFYRITIHSQPCYCPWYPTKRILLLMHGHFFSFVVSLKR